MRPSDRNKIFHIEAYYKSGDLAHDPMTVARHDRLSYKKGTMDLSKLLDDQLVPRSAGGKESMPVTGKFGLIFSCNGLIFPSIRKRTSAGRTAGPCAVPSDKITMLEMDYQPAEKQRFWNSV